MKKYRIAYLCQYNPTDLKTNSGTQYYMVQALLNCENKVDIFYPKGTLYDLCIKIGYRIYAMMNQNSSMFFSSLLYSRILTIYFRLFVKLNEDNYDFVFVSRGAPIVAGLKTKVPVIYTSDATFRAMFGYYLNYTDISEYQYGQGDMLESQALARSRKVFYPSEWAAKSARIDYSVPPDRVSVIPSGANFDPVYFIDIESILIRRFPSNACRLLFIGRDWVEKGGNIVYDAANFLTQWGVRTELVVVGCKPSVIDLPEWVTVEEYLDKNLETDFRKLQQLYINSHFLVVPTRNEAFGLVFSEACAFGLPILATDTGGVSMSVVNNKNGYLFPLEATGSDFAKKIEHLWRHRDDYFKFAYAAQEHYLQNVNWKTWGNRVQELMMELAAASRHASCA